jgi:hypothetical protein
MRWWLYCVLILSGMLACTAAEKNAELRLRLSVPKDIAAQAARRAGGDATAPAPVLLLHGLEFGANEGFKIEVLGEPRPGAAPVLLGSTAVVGHPQRTPQPPLQKIDLPVPLSDSADPLLAKAGEVTIILRFPNIDPERPPVKIDSVTFWSSGKE